MKDDKLYKFYLSLDAEKDAIIKQAETIKSIASEDNHVLDSDKSRASYYEVISNQAWGNKENYDLCLNCEIGNDKIVKIICEYIEAKKEQ